VSLICDERKYLEEEEEISNERDDNENDVEMKNTE